MYLGLDIGTSSVKALLIDEDGAVIGTTASPLSLSGPHPGWAEQDPADWLVAVESALGKMRQQVGTSFDAIKGIGLTGQMHGATILDDARVPLVPAILWNDTRSAEEAADLDTNPIFHRVTGNMVFPGFTAPKLVWLERHFPEMFAKVSLVLLPKDFVRLWLTGEAITDMSDASGTSWLDVGGRHWSTELLDETNMTVGQMPTLVEGTEEAGRIRVDIAEKLGLPPGIPIAGGAGDNAASACGLGVIGAGDAFVSIGTSGVLFAATDEFAPNAEKAVHAFCHSLPGRWHQMGVMLSAAGSLDWLASVVGQTPAQLVDGLGSELRPPSTVKFLPYLSGERTPHNDAAVRGAFTGLNRNTSRADLTQAVLEGVAFALRDNHEALFGDGTAPDRLTAVGGGAKSQYWVELIATVLDVPVAVPVDGDHGAALGAARLGLIASTNADPAAICVAPEIANNFEPRADLESVFSEAYSNWRQLYPSIVEH